MGYGHESLSITEVEQQYFRDTKKGGGGTPDKYY